MVDLPGPHRVPAWFKCLGVISLLVLALPTQAADIAGKPRIIDGNTIEIAGERIRLHGIDAPEKDQTCEWPGIVVRCGEKATLALTELIGGSGITCQGDTRGRHGHLIAVCHAGGVDINAAMVRQGWALAYRLDSMDYVDEEAVAKDAGVGMWRGEFVPPWEWRRGVRSSGPSEGAICVRGTLTDEGVECPALRTSDGSLYSLLGELGELKPGETVCLCGKPVAMSFCMRGTTLSVSRVANPEACSDEEKAGVSTYIVYRDNRPVLRIIDRPGPLTSTALLAPGATPVSHPFLTASALAAMEEDQLRRILDVSNSTADFLENLRKAGYKVQRE